MVIHHSHHGSSSKTWNTLTTDSVDTPDQARHPLNKERTDETEDDTNSTQTCLDDQNTLWNESSRACEEGCEHSQAVCRHNSQVHEESEIDASSDENLPSLKESSDSESFKDRPVDPVDIPAHHDF